VATRADDGFKYASIAYYIPTTDEVNMEAKLIRADIVIIAWMNP
jgi:hypothetical protein